MTDLECGRLLAMFSLYYPNFKPNNNAREMATAWSLVLQDYSYEEMQNALITYIRSNQTGFAPDVGSLIEIANQVREEVGGTYMNGMEAWAIVRKAISHGSYHAKEDFAELPPLIQEALGGVEQGASNIKEWAVTNIEEVETVIQSNFLKNYRTVQQRAKTRNVMPQEIKDRLAMNSNTVALINDKQEIKEVQSTDVADADYGALAVAELERRLNLKCSDVV